MLTTLELLINNFYPRPKHLDSDVAVICSEECEVHYNIKDDIITLGEPLLDMFDSAKLPKFTLMYHEAGHRWFSKNLDDLVMTWENLDYFKPEYRSKYFHLLNWIEDFYIEDKIVKTFPFLTDIVSCLRMVPSKDLTSIKNVFNYLYITGKPSPAFLDPQDQQTFMDYFNRCYNLRKHPNFGTTPLSNFVSRNSIEVMFVNTIVEFYEWLVLKDVFDDNVVLPQTPHPIVQVSSGNNGSNTGNKPTLNSTTVNGTSTSYSTIIGGSNITFSIPEHNNKTLIKMYKEECKRFIGLTSNNNTSLDGIFNGKFIDSNIMSNNINIKNCFEPMKLMDENIFRKKERCFNSVSIYRDISGSTHYSGLFDLINETCKQIIDKIPIQYNFYLYASGDISIVQLPFINWDDYTNTPDEYNNDKNFKQLGNGTNSGAIANVIAEQFNDKHLNIVITDGDLHDLFKRSDIHSLLQNIFTIFVGDRSESYSDSMQPGSFIHIKDESEINNTIKMIANF